MKKPLKIVVAGGYEQADYIISNFAQQKKQNLIVINSDKDFARSLAEKHSVNVYCGDSFKKFTLEEANVFDADFFIALDKADENNFVSCKLAKEICNVKKCICTVTNPKNVAIFQELGIDSVICSTHLLGESIKSESNFEDVFKTLSIENGKINIIEVKISVTDAIANKRIMDIGFPKNANIACIYRKPNVIIPNGQTKILENDKLTVVCERQEVENIKTFIKDGKVSEIE